MYCKDLRIVFVLVVDVVLFWFYNQGGLWHCAGNLDFFERDLGGSLFFVFDFF